MELKVENLFFKKEGKEILKNISFSLKSGEKAVLIGVNGSGKTTLLKLLNALYFPTSGKITVDGEELGKKNFTKRFENSFRQKCVLLFQNYEAMFFCKNLYEEITFSPKRFGFENIDAIARKSAEKFGLTEKLDDFAFNLSGGERQRAALACIYALSPSLALLDEPTSALDPSWSAKLAEFLGESKATTLVSTHNLSLASELGNRAIVMKEGQIEFDGDINEFLRDERLMTKAGLTHAHMHAHNGQKHTHVHAHNWN